MDYYQQRAEIASASIDEELITATAALEKVNLGSLFTPFLDTDVDSPVEADVAADLTALWAATNPWHPLLVVSHLRVTAAAPGVLEALRAAYETCLNYEATINTKLAKLPENLPACSSELLHCLKLAPTAFHDDASSQYSADVVPSLVALSCAEADQTVQGRTRTAQWASAAVTSFAPLVAPKLLATWASRLKTVTLQPAVALQLELLNIPGVPNHVAGSPNGRMVCYTCGFFRKYRNSKPKCQYCKKYKTYFEHCANCHAPWECGETRCRLLASAAPKTQFSALNASRELTKIHDTSKWFGETTWYPAIYGALTALSLYVVKLTPLAPVLRALYDTNIPGTFWTAFAASATKIPTDPIPDIGPSPSDLVYALGQCWVLQQLLKAKRLTNQQASAFYTADSQFMQRFRALCALCNVRRSPQFCLPDLKYAEAAQSSKVHPDGLWAHGTTLHRKGTTAAFVTVPDRVLESAIAFCSVANTYGESGGFSDGRAVRKCSGCINQELPAGRYGHSMACLASPDGQSFFMIVTGGVDEAGNGKRDVLLYSSATKLWSTCDTTLPYGVMFHATTTALTNGQHFLVCSGGKPAVSAGAQSTVTACQISWVQQLPTFSTRWAPLPSLPLPCSDHALTAFKPTDDRTTKLVVFTGQQTYFTLQLGSPLAWAYEVWASTPATETSLYVYTAAEVPTSNLVATQHSVNCGVTTALLRGPRTMADRCTEAWRTLIDGVTDPPSNLESMLKQLGDDAGHI